MAKLTLRMKVELYEYYLRDIATHDLVAIEEKAFSGPELEGGRKNYAFAFGYVNQSLRSAVETAQHALAQGAKK